ncbi:hypothetical protein VSR69_33005 [Paraburkholderia phytofirmans]|uniref:hypothetical protein n=1 Tax=Paraburkholderia sp. BL9I2N2 TaxID=1938809 RepID=UPI00104CDA34|nr:hypothetical protein [Paraburkholderia sp. BL9I2N2]TCK96020.1 hypothetical protein B0G74_2664 [Paraburkholderia sp. BL9I2N2]
MSDRSNRAKTAKSKRDGPGGAVMLIPHVVLFSDAFLTLSGNGVKLLVDIAQQYNTRNNGALLCSWRYMNEKRGWRSQETLNRARLELLERDLIFLTVQGRMPNKASWYAITWAALDKLDGLDVSPAAFPRGAYARWKPSPKPDPKTESPVRKPYMEAA